MELVQSIARWLHIIAGVMWIGLLYFFNFINVHFAATLDADSKKSCTRINAPSSLLV